MEAKWTKTDRQEKEHSMSVLHACKMHVAKPTRSFILCVKAEMDWADRWPSESFGEGRKSVLCVQLIWKWSETFGACSDSISEV